MSKIYEALKHAERERSGEQREALAQLLKRTAEEREILRAEVSACQEQLAALTTRVDAAPAIDPAAIDDLGRRVGQLAAQQERLASGPRQLLEEALQRFNEELGRNNAAQQDAAQHTQRLSEEACAATTRMSTRVDELASRTARALDEQAQRSEAFGAALESLRARLADTETARHAAAQRWQEDLERLSAALAEAPPAVTAPDVGRVEEVRAGLDAVRERLAAGDDERRGLQQRWEEQLAEQRQALTSLSAEALRVAVVYRSESQAAQRDLVAQLAAAEQAQSETDRRVRDVLDGVHAALAGQQQAAAEIAALRAEVAPLAAARARLQELADGAGRAQAAADEAVRRVAAIDGALASSLAALREQIAALRADRPSLRDAVNAVQASLAGQQQAAAEIAALRAEVAPLAAAQARLQELADGAGRAQTAADEAARRVAAIDDSQASGMAALQQQIAALQADRASLRDAADAVQASLAGQQQAAAEMAALRQQIAALQADRASLRDAADAVQAALAGQQQAAAEIAALRAQVAPLAEAQARLQELADGLRRTRAKADEAVRRAAAVDDAQESGMAALRQQLAALHGERGSARHARSRQMAQPPGSPGTPPTDWQSTIAAVLTGVAVVASALAIFFLFGKAPLSNLLQGLNPQLRGWASALGLEAAPSTAGQSAAAPAPAGQSAAAAAADPAAAVLKGLVVQDAALACPGLAARCSAACKDSNVGGLPSRCIDVLNQTRSAAANPSRQSVDRLVKMTGSCRTWCVLVESAKQAGVTCNQLGEALSAYSSAPRSGFIRQCGWYSI